MAALIRLDQVPQHARREFDVLCKLHNVRIPARRANSFRMPIGGMTRDEYRLPWGYLDSMYGPDGSRCANRVGMRIRRSRAFFLDQKDNFDPQWALSFTNENSLPEDMPIVLPNVALEGIDFNIDDLNETSLPYIDLKDYQRGQNNKPYRLIKIGRFYITNCPHEKFNKMPEIEASRNEAVERWVERVNISLRHKQNEVQRSIVSAQERLLKLQKSIGFYNLMLDVSKNGIMERLTDHFTQLENHGFTKSVAYKDKSILFTTKEAYANIGKEEKYSGQYEVRLGMHGLIEWRNIRAYSEDISHPHGSCYGGFVDMIGQAYATMDLYTVMIIVYEFLQHVNPNDSGAFRRWKEAPTREEVERRTKWYVTDWRSIIKEPPPLRLTADEIDETDDEDEED